MAEGKKVDMFGTEVIPNLMPAPKSTWQDFTIASVL